MTKAGHQFSSCSSKRQQPAATAARSCFQQQAADWNETSEVLCHQLRPSPAQRWRHPLTRRSRSGIRIAPWTSMQSWMLLVVITLMLCCQQVDGKPHGTHRLQRRTELVFDKGVLPKPRMELKPRNEALHKPGHKSHGAKPNHDSGLQKTVESSQIPLPHPFDTSLGNNFTASSCPTFFNNFLTNDTFNDCLPFSLLLQTSNGFFAATRSLVSLTQTLDATCNVNFDQCSSLMVSLAQEIQSPDNCGADLEMRNPMVTQAYNGFMAYQPLYHAGCLTDSEGDYCFANAVTNASAPSSSYVYYLPLGVQLPGGTQPTCDTCLQNTMAIFATYASNNSQLLSTDYGTAAQQVDMSCGPRFVESSVQMTSTSSLVGRVNVLSFLPVVAILLLFLS